MSVTSLKSKACPRRLREWVCVLLILPSLLLILGNLIGATSVGTSFFEERIEKRLGLFCKVSRLGWTPWSGGTVRDLSISVDELSDPLVEVDVIQLDLSWISALKGEKRFDELLVQGVKMELTLEELGEIMTSRMSHPKPQALARKETTENDLEVTSEVEEKRIERPNSKKNVADRQNGNSIPVVLPVDDFEGKMILRDLNFKLSSEQQPNLSVTLSGIEGEIPLWGKERSGELILSGVQIGKDGNTESLKLPLNWENGLIKFEEPQVQLLGVRFSLKGSLRLVRGLPYGVKIDLPSQRINFTSMLQSAPPIDLWSFKSENTLQGYLLAPTYVYGNSKSEVGTVIIKDPRDGSQLRFERGLSELSLSPEGLYSRQFHLIGDEEAFLGNGYLFNSGEGAATLRLVTSPMRAREYENRIRSGQPDWSFFFEPLNTPDRMYRDLRVDFGDGNIWVDLRKDGKSIPFQEFFGKVLAGQGSQLTPNLP